MLKRAVMLTKTDSVATLVNDVSPGDEVLIKSDTDGFKVIANSHIPFGHKIALMNIEKGSYVLKYGEPIGTATTNIDIGDYVHTHNMESNRGRGDLEVKQA